MISHIPDQRRARNEIVPREHYLEDAALGVDDLDPVAIGFVDRLVSSQLEIRRRPELDRLAGEIALGPVGVAGRRLPTACRRQL